LLILCAASAHAQLYKSVGPDGKVTYSDTPPSGSAKRVETKAMATGGINSANFPYELSEAVKNNPVTVYTGAKCVACDEGRKLLNARGIPYTEKTVASNEDIARLRQAGGESQLPLLLVGRNKHQGFEAGAWGATLTAAGYPETSKLPNSYRNPPAEAAAPSVKPVAANPPAKANPAASRSSDDVPSAAGNAPPGFRF
jgi:glutaredoxin